MPDVSRSGSALLQPAGAYAIQELETGKFRMTNGTVSVAITGPDGSAIATSGVSGYAEGTTVATGTAPFLLFRGTGGTTTIVGTASPLPVYQAQLLAGEDLTNNVLGVMQKPIAATAYSPSTDTNFGAAKGTGVAVKATPGAIFSAYVTSGTTAQRYFQIFNSATALAVGGTPVASYPIGVGSVLAGDLAVLQLDTTHFAPSLYLSTGIACAISSTNGTLGTAAVTAADYTWHIKYV